MFWFIGSSAIGLLVLHDDKQYITNEPMTSELINYRCVSDYSGYRLVAKASVV